MDGQSFMGTEQTMRMRLLTATASGVLGGTLAAFALFGPAAPALAGAPSTPAAPTTGASAVFNDGTTQGLMHSVFIPLTTVLPLSFDDQAFRKVENRPRITAILKELMDHSADLEHHVSGKRERAFSFVAKSLKHDARHLYRWYTSGAFDEARFTLHNMTENCITCHSSLPEGAKVPPAIGFFQAVQVDAMHPLERAHYQVMSRQFDAALATYEGFFQQADVPPSSITTLGSFVDYLRINANVKQDLERPRRFLDAIARRDGVTPSAKDLLLKWTSHLEALTKEKTLAKPGLAEARKVVEQGRALMEFPQDRDGLVYYLVAGSMLNRYVYSHPESKMTTVAEKRDLGEAYYLLGVTESLLGHSFWISRSEFYLESAIRLAPQEAFARKAYDLLETSYTVSFSGSSGTHVPDDVRELLAELRHLIAQARGSKA